MARSVTFAFLIMFLCIRSFNTTVVNECENKLNDYFQKVWYKGYVPSVISSGKVTQSGYHDIRFYYSKNEASLIDVPNKDTRENLINFQRNFKCEGNTYPFKFSSNSNVNFKDGFPTLYENLLEYIPNQYFRVPKESLARYLIWDLKKVEDTNNTNNSFYFDFKVSVYHTKGTDSTGYLRHCIQLLLNPNPNPNNLLCNSLKCVRFPALDSYSPDNIIFKMNCEQDDTLCISTPANIAAVLTLPTNIDIQQENCYGLWEIN